MHAMHGLTGNNKTSVQGKDLSYLVQSKLNRAPNMFLLQFSVILLKEFPSQCHNPRLAFYFEEFLTHVTLWLAWGMPKDLSLQYQ